MEEKMLRYRRFGHRPLQFFLRGFLKIWGGYGSEGEEHVPPEGACIIVCNHLSFSDPVAVMAAVPRPLSYMAMAELFTYRWLGSIVKVLGAFPVRRGEADKAALAEFQKRLKEGEAVVVFPEGYISTDGLLKELQPGAVFTAMRLGCPVIPLALKGTNRFLPLDCKFPHLAYKNARIGEPLIFTIKDGVPLKKQLAENNLKVRQALLNLGLEE